MIQTPPKIVPLKCCGILNASSHCNETQPRSGCKVRKLTSGSNELCLNFATQLYTPTCFYAGQTNGHNPNSTLI